MAFLSLMPFSVAVRSDFYSCSFSIDSEFLENGTLTFYYLFFLGGSVGLDEWLALCSLTTPSVFLSKCVMWCWILIWILDLVLMLVSLKFVVPTTQRKSQFYFFLPHTALSSCRLWSCLYTIIALGKASLIILCMFSSIVRGYNGP